MSYKGLIDDLYKQAGWIERGKDGKLRYQVAGDDGLSEAIYRAEADDLGDLTQAQEDHASKKLYEAIDYGNSLVEKHPKYQKVLDDLNYRDERNKIQSPIATPVSYGLLAGVPTAAALGVRALNKKLKSPLGKNMGKTIAGGLIGGLIAGGTAGNAINERKRIKMGYPARGYDDEWNMAEDIDQAVNAKYWPKTAFEIIDELMEKTSAFRTNFTQMVESSLKNADPMRKHYPPKPLTEIKKLKSKSTPPDKLWKNPNLEKNAANVPWHGIRVAIKDFDKDRKAAKAAYDALPDAAKEQVKRQRKEAEKHLLKGPNFKVKK